MSVPQTMYVFKPAERAIFAEIYFPKKVIYQPAIFTALRFGHSQQWVKKYLEDHVEALLQELEEYRGLLDPQQYKTGRRLRRKLTIADAEKRISNYVSYFAGWSMYEVDGVWEKKKEGLSINATVYPIQEEQKERKEEPPDVIEERTQVIRVVFRIPTMLEKERQEVKYFDVLRAMIYWVVGIQGSLDEHCAWSKAEQARFMMYHRPWLTKKKAAFATKHFTEVAQEVEKWIDDCGLFIFGYLVTKTK